MKFLATLLLSLMMPLAQAGEVPLTIGDTTIGFAAEPGYVALSKADPQAFAVAAAAMPPTNRLVEAFESPADLARRRAGGAVQEMYFQVQALREVESQKVSLDDWNAIKPQLTAGMAKFDLDTAKDNEGANARMSAAAGQPISVNVGKIGQPTIYRETPMSVSFTMLMPIQVNVGGQVQNRQMAVAGSMVVLRNKLVYLYAIGDSTGLNDLRAHLDGAVDRAIALNPSDGSVPSTGGFAWTQLGRSALIGAGIGILVGVLVTIGLIFRRKDR